MSTPEWASRAYLRLQSYLARLIELYRSGWRVRWLTHGLVGVGVVFLAVRALHRRYIAKYKTNLSATVCGPEYDYIVIGSGSAGSAVAVRLAEQDPHIQVLLLEAGGSDDSLNVHVPAAAIKLQRKAETDWNYSTEPQQHAHANMEGRVGHWPRGKVLGGSSSLNYMLFVRGAAADFDSWAAGGCGADWSYAGVLPYFQRLESVSAASSTVAASPLRGESGPMPCNLIISPQPATEAFLQAVRQVGDQVGLPGGINPDYNGKSIYGAAISQYNVKGGRRWNTATAYLAPALQKHSNLHVLTHAHVQRVIFNAAKEAVGVALKRGTDAAKLRDQPEAFIRARREVLLCGGAIGSPQLLELSGVGRPEVLAAAGIPLVQALPGVGENLQDHLSLPLFHECSVSTLSAADETLSNVWQWLRHGTGPLTGNMVEALAWFNTPAHDKAKIPTNMPDMQFHFLAGTIASTEMSCFNTKADGIARFKAMVDAGLKWTTAIMPTLLHPLSRGTVHVRSRNALDAPAIQPNYLSERADVDVMVEACKVALKLYDAPALKGITKRRLTDEMAPDNPYSLLAQPDQYWEHYVRAQANTLYHPVGTCKMGASSDPLAVVDPQLRVYGVSRLRVADASVMPHLTSGNTNIPSVMIGEKAADLIKAARDGTQPPQQQLTQAQAKGAPTNSRSKL